MATDWKTTYLDKPSTYGGIEPMGTGPYGGTIWTTTAAPDGGFLSTGLENTADITWEVVR